MACMQASRFRDTTLCCKPKAEFRAGLNQSGAQLTLGFVDAHAYERGLMMRVRLLAYRRARACVRHCMYECHDAKRWIKRPQARKYTETAFVKQLGQHGQLPKYIMASEHAQRPSRKNCRFVWYFLETVRDAQRPFQRPL